MECNNIRRNTNLLRQEGCNSAETNIMQILKYFYLPAIKRILQSLEWNSSCKTLQKASDPDGIVMQ